MSIVEKMAKAIRNHGGPRAYAWDELGEKTRANYTAEARAALSATGLTEEQLEGLANGTHVVVPVEPPHGTVLALIVHLQDSALNGMTSYRDDALSIYHIMLAAKEG